ncbi:TFP11-domain-containing protein [Hymenopellis radicata]|nr:TFP11-domain-containing protein [Hymenopellis radicata]
MARRKRVLDDGDDSDSSSAADDRDDFGLDNDAREERDLFENPYQRKRKRNGKEDAIYGVFGEDSDEDRRPVRTVKKKKKATTFVQASTSKQDTQSGGSDEGEGEDDQDMSDDSEPSRPPSPRIREAEDDDNSAISADASGVTGFSRGGIGATSQGGVGSSRSGIGSSHGGLGSSFAAGIGATSSPKPATKTNLFAKAGIGAKSDEPKPESKASTSAFASTSYDDFPSSFSSNRSSSFLRGSQPSTPPVLDSNEQRHFEQLSGTFGARMLAKMGWQAGTGLGVTGEGIVTPVETKMRPERSGIAFRGFKEKTKQSKMEAKRRGEVISDDETDNKLKKKAKAAREKRSDVWKNPKKVKTKVEHKSYEQILADAGDTSVSGIGQIIDATGAVPKEVSSLAEISLNSWSPSNDPTRIPEVRHNIRLITDACKSDFDGLAREAKSLDEKKKWVIREDARLRKNVEEEADLIARLQQVQLVSAEINTMSKELAGEYEPSLKSFDPLFERLLEYEREFKRYRLDEIVVGAIAPVVRRMVTGWNPLQEPTFLVDAFRTWRAALPVNDAPEKPQNQVDVYGTHTVPASTNEELKPMTPFESLLWNVWLPKVRTTINNEWSAQNPNSAVKLYEAWSTFLPPFIRDNMLDQLILPKTIVFPWLPYVGLRLEDLVDEARRKVKNLLRHWTVGDEVPKDLVFNAGDWDNMLLKSIVPKLGATLRNDLRINPRNQRMEPLNAVLQWSPILRPSIVTQLLETEFFPKWLDVLHVWLIQPQVSFEEVAQWYQFWKTTVTAPGVERGFTRGLQLMNQAIELGSSAPTKLAKPDFRAEIAPPPAPSKKAAPRPSASRTQEITFKSIVEEFAASHNLLVIPSGRAHEKSRMPLFRVSRSTDGKGGLLVYILDDAVWAAVEGIGGPAEDYIAITLDSMVLRAGAS